MDKTIHIGFICHEYPPCNHGGIGSFTKDLAHGLVQAGFKVSVIGIYSPGVLDISEPIIELDGEITVYRFPLIAKTKFKRLNVFLERRNLYRYLKQINAATPFDIIESPESQGWLPMGAPKGIPLVTRFHGGESYFALELKRKSSRLSKILEKSQIQHSKRIVSVSDHTARVTLKLFNIDRPYAVIHNSVKVPKELLAAKSYPIHPHRIVFTGSVIPKKGVAELVKAMNDVFVRFPDAELYIAGKNQYQIDGRPFKEVMLDTLEHDEFRQRVKFLGSVDRETVLFPLIASADVCCYPSYSEAFALTPLEAMAIGKAVVFTKRSSGPEAIEDGISGLLCDPSDPNDIAFKIMEYFDDPKKALRIAEAGQKRVAEHFGYDMWVSKNIQFFNTLLKDEDAN